MRKGNNKKGGSNNAAPQAKGAGNTAMQAQNTLVDRALRLPFINIVGEPIRQHCRAYTYNKSTMAIEPVSVSTSIDSVPGLAVIHYIPFYGEMDNITSPVNRAATRMWQTLRFGQNMAQGFDIPDVPIGLIALSSILDNLKLAERIYYTARLWVRENKFLPETLLKAQHFPILREEQEIYRWYSRMVSSIGKLSSLPIPALAPIITGHQDLLAGYYTDSETGSWRDQIYCFLPEGYYEFGYDSDGAGMLNFEPFYFGDATWAGTDGTEDKFRLLDIIDRQIEKLYNDEEFLRFGSQVKNLGIPVIEVKLPEEYGVAVPIYDAVMMQSIENMKVIPNTTFIDKVVTVPGIYNPLPTSELYKHGFDIIQSVDKDYIHQMHQIVPCIPYFWNTTVETEETSWDELWWDSAVDSLGLDPIINSDSDNVTGDDILHMQRFVPFVRSVRGHVQTWDEEEDKGNHDVVCPSIAFRVNDALITDVRVTAMQFEGDDMDLPDNITRHSFHQDLSSIYFNGGMTSEDVVYNYAAAVETFKHLFAPDMLYPNPDDVSGAWPYGYDRRIIRIRPLCNYQVLDEERLQTIKDALDYANWNFGI